MCRKNELLGSVMMAFGAGLLAGLLIASDFVLAILGVVLLIGGLLVAKKCC